MVSFSVLVFLDFPPWFADGCCLVAPHYLQSSAGQNLVMDLKVLEVLWPETLPEVLPREPHLSLSVSLQSRMQWNFVARD